LINFFIPLESVKESREKFFNTLHQIASAPKTSQNIKEKMIEDMYLFLESEQQTHMLVQWLEKGQAFAQDAPNTAIMNLTLSQKRNLLKGVFSKSTIRQEAKLVLIQ